MQTYLYLARRDKKGLQVITVFAKGKQDFPPTRIRDINQLGLPDRIASGIKQIIHKERMMWEPFVECAENYDCLKSALMKRGYQNLPPYVDLAFPLIEELVSKTTQEKTPDVVNKDTLKKMLRKKN